MQPTQTPVTIDSGDGKSVELGLKFKSDTNGYVTGLRFYKASANTGIHVGHIWSSTGTLLGSATFSGESASGWQQVNFVTPISVTANTTYVASYFAPTGHYSETENAFTTAGINNVPLHALSGPNGVYVYGSLAFPNSSWDSTNYWVDVVFAPGSPAASNPQLTVGAASLAFGSVTVNSASTKTLTLTSSGTSAVTVNSAAITGAGFTVSGASFPLTLNAGQSATLTVQFKPTATGAASGQLTINSNSTTGSSVVVALSGTGAAAVSPQLTVSAASLAFGNVTVNSASTKTVTLTSSGTSAVTVNSAAITGKGYTVSGASFPLTLNAGQSATLTVQFKPTATGAVTGQLTISSNSTTGSSVAIALSGTGAAAANPQLTVSAASLAFGSVTVNSASIKTVTLTSSGTSALTVNSAAITGSGFTIVASSFPATLNAGQSVTLQIQFKPTATGAVTGQLTINSNSTTGSTTTVALTGTGAAAANPQLTVSSASLAFGSVTLNTASTKTVTLTSSGTSALTVNSAAITGAGFTVSGATFPLTLNAGQTATLTVQFDPTVAGAASGQLTISSNSTTGSSVAVALSGTGAATSHEVDLYWNAPSTSPDPVAGYRVYRSTASGSYSMQNGSLILPTTYIDTNVASGTVYNYMIKSVDANGIESVASNTITVTVP